MKITEGRKPVGQKGSTWAEKREYLIELLQYKYDSKTLSEEFLTEPMADKILKQFKEYKLSKGTP